NDNGKKVFFYKSKIRTIELTLNRKQFILQFKRNENTFSKKPIDTASENKVICITEQKQK
ncbi:MAG: hypothetical protein ACTHKK_01170, partial [Candidatus Nitrosocosmicus sp.]